MLLEAPVFGTREDEPRWIVSDPQVALAVPMRTEHATLPRPRSAGWCRGAAVL